MNWGTVYLDDPAHLAPTPNKLRIMELLLFGRGLPLADNSRTPHSETPKVPSFAAPFMPPGPRNGGTEYINGVATSTTIFLNAQSYAQTSAARFRKESTSPCERGRCMTSLSKQLLPASHTPLHTNPNNFSGPEGTTVKINRYT